jgi:hypothetical protein
LKCLTLRSNALLSAFNAQGRSAPSKKIRKSIDFKRLQLNRIKSNEDDQQETI